MSILEFCLKLKHLFQKVEKVSMIRVMLADDHHLVRQGIRSLLEKAQDIEVIGEAADGEAALELVIAHIPDVLILDIAMPLLNGIQVAEQIQLRKLPTRVVMLSMYDDESLVRRALRYGAIGYLLKRSVSEELHTAVRSASRNSSYLSPSLSQTLLTNNGSPLDDKTVEPEPYDRLSPRERQVLQLLAEGLTNAAIAQHLTLSIKTIEKHRANLMLKLNVQDMASLIRKAITYELVFFDG
jgi:DNA-binding NarL/FixJ family response regulator